MGIAGYFSVQAIWRWSLARRWNRRSKRLAAETPIPEKVGV
jgi:hypothetical protein